MAIAADSSSPTGPPSAADRAAVGGAAASETSITASAVVASAAITIAIANNYDYPRDGIHQMMTTDDRMDDTEEKEHGGPSSMGIETLTLMGGNGDDVRGYEGDVVAARTVITPTAKSLLRAYFVSVNWPLNKVLPKGGKLLSSDLGVIMRDHGLVKTQVSCQLLNYKKQMFVIHSRARADDS